MKKDEKFGKWRRRDGWEAPIRESYEVTDQEGETFKKFYWQSVDLLDDGCPET